MVTEVDDELFVVRFGGAVLYEGFIDILQHMLLGMLLCQTAGSVLFAIQ